MRKMGLTICRGGFVRSDRQAESVDPCPCIFWGKNAQPAGLAPPAWPGSCRGPPASTRPAPRSPTAYAWAVCADTRSPNLANTIEAQHTVHDKYMPPLRIKRRRRSPSKCPFCKAAKPRLDMCAFTQDGQHRRMSSDSKAPRTPEWLKFQSQIRQLYIERGLTLKQVMDIMKEEHGFYASHG